MDKCPNTRNGTAHQELVEHLLRSMERQGLTIEAANVPGHRRPRPVKLGLRRARLCPDVIARDGRRAIFGVALHEAEASAEYTRNQLETFASRCRMLVVCIPGQAADRAVGALFHNADMLHWRKMRVLRHPEAEWLNVPRWAQTKRRKFDHAPVRVVVEGA